MSEFTVWVQQDDGRGTTHIASYEAKDETDAADQALNQVCADWGRPPEARATLHVLGIARGKIALLEWNDIE